jgi:hypothetical protein
LANRVGGGLKPALQHVLFGPAEGGEIICAGGGIVGHEEFIELRGRDGGAGQHGMGLAAVVLAVEEQVHQGVGHTLGLDAGVAVDVDGMGKAFGGKGITQGKGAVVEGGSCGGVRSLRRGYLGNDERVRSGYTPNVAQ